MLITFELTYQTMSLLTLQFIRKHQLFQNYSVHSFKLWLDK